MIPGLVTPGEVDAVQFTQVRSVLTARQGYDEVEVDEFLDRVAETIAVQAREIDALRAMAVLPIRREHAAAAVGRAS